MTKNYIYIKLIAIPLSLCIGSYLMLKKHAICSVSEKKAGTVIILNGPSASGKTTLQKELQLTLSDFYLRIGIDNFFDAVLPEAIGKSMIKKDPSSVESTRYFPEGISPQEWQRVTALFDQTDQHGLLIRAGIQTTDSEGNPLFILKVGPRGNEAIYGMHRAIATYAQAGNNVIIDYILYEQEWLKDLVCVLSDLNVYFIGVHIPLDVLEAREKARATSPVGHARSHYATVHTGCIYDFEINTSELTPEQAALAVKQFIESKPKTKALNNLKINLGL